MKKPSRPEQSKRAHGNAQRTTREKKSDAQSGQADLAHVQEELRQRTAELAIINSVQQGLASQLGVHAIYDLVGDKIRDIFNAQVVMISLYDPQTDTVEHRYAIERDKRVYVAEPQPVGGFRRRIIQSGEPLLVNTNVAQQARALGQPTLPRTETPRSWLGAPMQVGQRVTGVMSLQNLDQENAFNESDLRLLQTLANAMSVALENARLFDETQRLLKETEQRAVELATVNRVSHALASQVELDALIQLAGQQIRETFNADIAYIALLDPASHWIRFPYTFGEEFTPIQYGEGLTSKIIEMRQPLLINQDLEIRREQIGATHVGIAVKSYLGVPILVGGHAIGGVSVQSIQQEGRFDENDQHLLMTIAANVGVAIERAQRFHTEKRRAEQFQIIAEMGRHVTALLDTNQIMQQVTQLLRQAFDYYHVGIGLIEGDEVVYRVGSGVLWDDPDFGFKPSRLKIGKEGITGWVAAHGEPLIVPDVSQDSRYVWLQGSATRSELIVPISIKAQVIGVLDVQSDQLSAFDSTDLAVAQSIANQTGAALENARYFAAERRRTEQFRVISQVGHRITSLLPVDELLNQMAQLIKDSFNYYQVGFGLIEGDEVVSKAEVGPLSSEYLSKRFKVGKEGIWGWVGQTGEPELVPDTSQEPRSYYSIRRAARVCSQLCVPLKTKDAVIGVLGAESDRPNALDESDLTVLQSLANQAAVAIENARLYERAQELAVMQERNRLARDLHDAVTQTLFSASLVADALPQTWENDPKQGRDLLRELSQLSRGALAEMRTLLLELRPSALVETKLGSLLRQLGEAAAGRSGLVVDVNVTNDCILPAEAHIAVYRIAQEALNNILKHARATQVTIDLSCRPSDNGQMIELSVSDDGRGFDPAQVPLDHFGLRNMRERAQAIGAELSVTSKPGHGTRIQVVWEKQGGAR